MKIFIKTLILFFILSNSSYAEKVNVFEFTEPELSNLEVRKVRGADNKTEYSVGLNDNGNYLKAVADNAASGLGKKVIIDLNKTPIINITWKIEKSLNGIKENTKKSVDNVLASTKENLNEWITVKANVKEDFKKFHNLDVNELDGLAIMSDTDNSKLKAIAYYQNIYFSAD